MERRLAAIRAGAPDVEKLSLDAERLRELRDKIRRYESFDRRRFRRLGRRRMAFDRVHDAMTVSTAIIQRALDRQARTTELLALSAALLAESRRG